MLIIVKIIIMCTHLRLHVNSTDISMCQIPRFCNTFAYLCTDKYSGGFPYSQDQIASVAVQCCSVPHMLQSICNKQKTFGLIWIAKTMQLVFTTLCHCRKLIHQQHGIEQIPEFSSSDKLSLKVGMSIFHFPRELISL